VEESERIGDCFTGLFRDDWHLTPKGRLQAAALGRRMAHIPLDAVLCSPLCRARETAQAVLDAQKNPCPITLMPELMEIGDYGDSCGKPETLGDVILRTRWVMQKVRATYKNGEHVLIAAHGGLNHPLLVEALCIDPMPAFRFDQKNTALSKVVYFGHPRAGSVLPWYEHINLRYMNDTRHLDTPEIEDQWVD
jgi:broad specificity phosphatase PhoE